MSRENVESVRRGIDAWNRGDLDDWLSGFAPEAELRTTVRFPDQRVYRGRAGLKRYWAEIREDIPELSLSVSELRTSGDRVFLAATGRGRGKRSEVPLETPVWFVLTLRNGLAVRLETYLDRNEALEAAGLEE
jgi:ketosteroid isomerase-like protein